MPGEGVISEACPASLVRRHPKAPIANRRLAAWKGGRQKCPPYALPAWRF
jgi:hypothetical protein